MSPNAVRSRSGPHGASAAAERRSVLRRGERTFDMLLAGEYLVLAQSPDPKNVYAGSPSLAQCPRLGPPFGWMRDG